MDRKQLDSSLILLAAMVFAILILFIAIPAEPAPKFPWTTFSGDMLGAVMPETVKMGGCPGGEIMIAAFRHERVVFVMLYAAESGRVVFYYDPNPTTDAPFTEVGFGEVNMSAHDRIPPLRWEPYVKGKNSNVCPFLFPTNA